MSDKTPVTVPPRSSELTNHYDPSHGAPKTLKGLKELSEAAVTIIGIDPGPKQSGIAILELPRMFVTPFVENNNVIENYLAGEWRDTFPMPVITPIEWVSNYGMAVGESIFKACFQAGRFSKCYDGPYDLITRPDIKIEICGSRKAKDTNVRLSIIDLFGGEDKAIGGKKCKKCKGKGWCGVGRPRCTECDGHGWLYPPGPLHLVKSHAWAALAVALAYSIKRGYINPSAVSFGGLCRSSQPQDRDGPSSSPKGLPTPQGSTS